jgi:hypothetical protein
MPESAAEPSVTLTLRRGTLRLPADLCARRFAGCAGVVLLVRDGRLLVLPVAGTGGHLLKIVTADGDRGIFAADVFRELGADESTLEGTATASLQGRWSDGDAALVVEGFRSTGNRNVDLPSLE